MASSVNVTAGDAFEPSQPGKWLVAASVMLGTFLSVMDATVVNVAMPHMMGSLGEDLLTITWVSTAYSIAEIIMVTMAAWFTALLGRKRLFLASMFLFIVGSVLAGTSRTFGQLIFYRVIQGIGGGSLIPCSQAIARETFPPAEQGMAMAIFSMGVIFAPAIGPVIGGWLVDHYGWRWVFYINVPFCIVGIMMVSAFVHDPPYLKRGIARIDWGGIILMTIGLTAVQVVLERGEEVDWFANNWIVAGTVIAALALAVLVIWELRSDEPIVDLRLLRNGQLAVGCSLGAVVGFALYGGSFLLPQFTQDLLNYPAYQAGLVLMPRAVAMMCAMPIIGRLYNHVSPRVLIGAGVALLAGAYWQLCHLSLEVSYSTFTPILIMSGIGMGAAMVTLATISLSTVPRPSMTGASSLYTLTRRESGNVAYAVLATLVARREQYHRSVLIDYASPLNPIFRQAQTGTRSTLGQSINPVGFPGRSLMVLNDAINRHATMLAYNDAFFIVVPMFLLVLPLLFLLPVHGYVPDSMPEAE